jgi:hypothetical protein
MIKLNTSPFFGVHTASHPENQDEGIPFITCIKNKVTQYLKSRMDYFQVKGTLPNKYEKLYYKDWKFEMTDDGLMVQKGPNEHILGGGVDLHTSAAFTTKCTEHKMSIVFDKSVKISHYQAQIENLLRKTCEDIFMQYLGNADHVFGANKQYKYSNDHVILALFHKHRLYCRTARFHDIVDGSFSICLRQSNYSTEFPCQELKWQDKREEQKILAVLMATHDRLGANSTLEAPLHDLLPIVMGEFEKLNEVSRSQIIDMEQRLSAEYRIDLMLGSTDHSI